MCQQEVDASLTSCVRGASYRYNNLVDIRRLTQLKHIKSKIVGKIRDIITSLEISSEQRVAKTYIGKMYNHRQKTAGGHYQDLNPMNSRTWKVGGISDRWKEHKSKDYGKDGMVVLAAVTEEAIPPQCQDRIKFFLDYAFANEGRFCCTISLSPQLTSEWST